MKTSVECNSNQPVTVDGSSLAVLPTPSRIDLKSIDQVRAEMARVYRSMKSGKIDTQDGTRMAYVLAQIGKLIEISELEARLSMLEARAATRQWGPRCEASVPG